MNNHSDQYPIYIEWIKRHYGAVIHLLWYIATETSDRGADIAARALALLAPVPNAVSVFNVSQHSLGYSKLQAFAFAAAVELSLFAIIEVALHMWNGWLDKPDRYSVPLAASILAACCVLAIIVTVVFQLEVATGGHWVLALLPLISMFAFVALGLKRWHERNAQPTHSAVAQKRTVRTVQSKAAQPAKDTAQTVGDDAQQAQDNAHPVVDKAERARQLKAEGFSNVEIGQMLDAHRNTVSKWLNGHSKAVQQ